MNPLSKSNKPLEDHFPNLQGKEKANSYSAITGDIEITVWPEFVDSQISPLGNLFIWAYHVRIANKGVDNVKLVNRHWRIIDEQGLTQEVDGEGVVGEQPQIISGNAFQYSSGVHLRHPSGIMSGHYQMQKENGEMFEAKIPAFSLDVPSIKTVIN